MSKKKHTPLPGLIDEHPILVYPKLAAAIGINEAIICQQLHYLLSSVEEVDKTFNYVNDRWWVYHTLEEWHDKYFCWIAIGTVGRLLRKLEDKGLILSMQSVKNPSDRTKWYTIDHDQWIEIISPIVTNCNYQPSLQNTTINTTNCNDGYDKTLVKEKKKEKDSQQQNAAAQSASEEWAGKWAMSAIRDGSPGKCVICQATLLTKEDGWYEVQSEVFTCNKHHDWLWTLSRDDSGHDSGNYNDGAYCCMCGNDDAIGYLELEYGTVVCGYHYSYLQTLERDYDSGHEAIALEIRAANDAMRGDDHEIFHDCIEDYIDTDETPATVDFVTYTGEPLSRCYNCKNQFPIGTSIAVITVGNMSTDFCRDCYADGDNHDKMVADLAARPALPVAENDDSFLGTRDAPITPDGPDWARGAVGNADDDIPDSTLCGYRDPEGHKLMCHDCYGEGVCGATGSDGWIHQQIVGTQEECSDCCKQIIPGETIARNGHDVNLCDDCYQKKRSSNADAMQVQRAETIARLAVAETLLGESREGILDTVVGLLQDEQPQPLTDRALELNNSLADRALALGLAMAGVEVIDNVAYRIGDVPALQVQDEQPHDIAWGKLKDEARLRKEQETPATSTDAIVPALEAQQNTTPTKKPKSLKTAKAKKRKKKEVHPLYQEMVDEIILAFDVKREHLDKQDFGRIGKEANLLLGKDAKPFMVKHLHAWLKKKFNTTFGYNTLSKWYAPFRADSNIPDDIPEKEEPAPPPESDGAEIVQGSKEDIQRILAETTAKMSMSQFGDENYEQSAD